MNLRSLRVACVACIVSVGICAADDVWVVRPDGVGPMKVGMTVAQLNTATHEKFSIPKDKEQQHCFYVTPLKHRDVLFMVEDGLVTRVDVRKIGTATAAGIRVGDSEAHAIRVYGPKLEVTPHAYTAPQGHYLTLRSKDDQYGIRFETDKKKIVRYYAGQFKAISYKEGCQ